MLGNPRNSDFSSFRSKILRKATKAEEGSGEKRSLNAVSLRAIVAFLCPRFQHCLLGTSSLPALGRGLECFNMTKRSLQDRALLHANVVLGSGIC